jgi:tRNA nucleotidyltransferase (CCA-adding enzyme)
MVVMETYLVGGAVRDQVLGLIPKERDWVVVGATVNDMLRLGFRPVGKDFPVFLHPETQEEYALARLERKVGRGYTGFTFDASPTVTLAEDLKRRDLTINAMAQAADGTLIDLYGGVSDLQKGILRHVSPAFAEDPVRILRVARFSARFKFQVATDTQVLMQQMVKAGEVNALVPERVWKELERALKEPYPALFFLTLKECQAFPILFPPLNLSLLQRATEITEDARVRFAALITALCEEELGSFCKRNRIPREYEDLALLTVRLKSFLDNLSSAESILQLLSQADAFRRPNRFFQF